MADAGEGRLVPINAVVVEADSIDEARVLASMDYGKTHPQANLSNGNLGDLVIEVSEVRASSSSS